MNTIVIDTNGFAAFKRGDPTAIKIIGQADNILVNSVVIGELITGFILGTKEKINRNELIQFLSHEKVLSIDITPATAEYYAIIIKDLRKKGKPIPTNDIWIAATALEFKAKVFTFDKHFKYIRGLKILDS